MTDDVKIQKHTTQKGTIALAWLLYSLFIAEVTTVLKEI